MEFLVHLQLDLAGMESEREVELRRQEAERARALARAGALIRLWRVPGAQANWGLWRAPDAVELQTTLASLPLWPWMTAEIHALDHHSNDPGEHSSRG